MRGSSLTAFDTGVWAPAAESRHEDPAGETLWQPDPSFERDFMAFLWRSALADLRDALGQWFRVTENGTIMGPSAYEWQLARDDLAALRDGAEVLPGYSWTRPYLRAMAGACEQTPSNQVSATLVGVLRSALSFLLEGGNQHPLDRREALHVLQGLSDQLTVAEVPVGAGPGSTRERAGGSCFSGSGEFTSASGMPEADWTARNQRRGYLIRRKRRRGLSKAEDAELEGLQREMSAYAASIAARPSLPSTLGAPGLSPTEVDRAGSTMRGSR